MTAPHVFARTRAILIALVSFALFASACSGSDSLGDIAAAVAETAENATDAAGDTGDTASTDDASAPDGFETDEDRYATLIANSDAVAEATVGDGRVVMGVDCLEGTTSPRAVVIVQGNDLPVGEHEGTAEGGSRITLRVFAEDVQDLPAGSTYYAAEAGFGEPSYDYTFESLGVSLTINGC